MRFHHVGCAVKSIEENVALYRQSLEFKRVSKPFEISSQNVRASFVEIGPGAFLEFIEPLQSGSPIDRFLSKGYYHVCFLTDDLAQTLERLQEFALVTEFQSEAFAGNRCAFLMSPQLHLIELAEMSAEAFQSFFDESLVPL